MKPNSTPNSYFQVLDEILISQPVKPLSLNPNKYLITSFSELELQVINELPDRDLILVFRDTLEKILNALLNNFPENIFWDFDFIVHSMVRQALLADVATQVLEDFGNKIVLLMDMFGKKSEIRFRYIHDFMYGFDWVRWVKKKPLDRNNLEPFCLEFLDSLLVKGEEILQRIQKDDSKYPQISEKRYRNPFDFSREPEDERLLLNYLAVRECIPVKAWEWNSSGVWNKPFYQIRETASQKLNITKK